ncbi:MAG: type II secretion system protein [Akkermansiaceae bacterium]|nr:type II secretion system protein [Akkermansiaceae bacterium]
MFTSSDKNGSRYHEMGFTLLEILVTISIIAVLTSFVFMVGSRFSQKAKATELVSNFRQIYVAINEIQQEGVQNGWNSRGTYPPYAGQIIDDQGWREFTIYDLIGEQIEVCEPESGGYKWYKHPKDTILQNPLSKHKFAGDTTNVTEIKRSSYGLGGYCYNAHLEVWVAPHSGKGTAKLTRDRDLVRPAKTILMAEMNDVGGKIWTGWGGQTAPHGNYNKGAHCLFVDGHIEHLSNDFLASKDGWQTHMRLESKEN